MNNLAIAYRSLRRFMNPGADCYLALVASNTEPVFARRFINRLGGGYMDEPLSYRQLFYSSDVLDHYRTFRDATLNRWNSRIQGKNVCADKVSNGGGDQSASEPTLQRPPIDFHPDCYQFQ